MKRTRILWTLALIAALGAGAGYAHSRPPASIGEHAVARLAHALDLDDAREDRVEAAFERHRPRLQAVREALRAERRALLEAMADGAEPGAIDARAQATAAQIAELVRALGALKRDVDGALDADQQRRLDAWLRELAARDPRLGRVGAPGLGG